MHYGIRLAKNIVKDIALGFWENNTFDLSVRNRKHRFQDLHSWHICFTGHWNSVSLSFTEGCVLGVLYAQMYTYVYAMWEHVETREGHWNLPLSHFILFWGRVIHWAWNSFLARLARQQTPRICLFPIPKPGVTAFPTMPPPLLNVGARDLNSGLLTFISNTPTL